ncbi:MAG: sel1 repeat family protein [Myxococcales bacterium]|nr:sel1 repeat family protein [Myxococcales bacterium]
MTARAWALAAVLLPLLLTIGAAPARAVDRDCPADQAWSPNLGACVARQATPKASPSARYYDASARLDRGTAAEAAKAVGILTATCGARHAPSCTLLGFVLERGRAGARDPAAAVERYQRGCELGDADGCLGAASVWALGLTGDPQPAKAIAPLTRACALGSGRGCYVLADKYAVALGVPEDDRQAATLYAQALARLSTECPGSGPSCYYLGLAYRDGNGVATDAVAAARAFATGCDGASGAACFALGELYRDGALGDGERPRALDYFDRSCQRYDNADGCHAAGAILAARDDADPARLTGLAERACQLSTAACDLAAFLYATGKGGAKDEARATHAYVTACQAGNATACSAAAARIAHGAGVPADGPLAVRIWERACETGSGSDCYQAALAHQGGELVPADPARALALLELGCVRKSAAACEDAALARLDGVGGEADVARATNLFDIGCALGRGETCTAWGDALRDGDGVTADRAAALVAYQRGCAAAIPDGAACAALAELTDDRLAGLGAAARACRLGDARACEALDDRARAAKADDATRQATVATLTEGCAATPPVEAACTTLAGLYGYGGYLVTAQPSRGHALALDACRRGAREACLFAADDLASGAGVVADAGAARGLYAELCDADVPTACFRLGTLLVDDDRATDAARLFARACDDGLASACASLGFAAYTGRGVDWDVARARALYQQACDAGDPWGCANLGELEELGVGAPPDPAAARAHYQAACGDAGSAGCARLALALEASDPTAARAHAARACDDGDPLGCAAAARLTTADPPARARLAQRAYDLAEAQAATNPYAAYLLGRFAADGVGTARDRAASERWFDRACVGRDPNGCLAAGAAHADAARGDQAVAAYDRACAAGVARGCELAASVRRRLPLGVRGCACRSGGEPRDLAIAALAAAALLIRRRRARPA